MGVIALVIVFLVEEENNFIEIDLNENIIDDREMFRQLFEKYKSIQKEQNEDINEFNHRIKKIEEIYPAVFNIERKRNIKLLEKIETERKRRRKIELKDD